MAAPSRAQDGPGPCLQIRARRAHVVEADAVAGLLARDIDDHTAADQALDRQVVDRGAGADVGGRIEMGAAVRAQVERRDAPRRVQRPRRHVRLRVTRHVGHAVLNRL